MEQFLNILTYITNYEVDILNLLKADFPISHSVFLMWIYCYAITKLSHFIVVSTQSNCLI